MVTDEFGSSIKTGPAWLRAEARKIALVITAVVFDQFSLYSTITITIITFLFSGDHK